jgi:hypothetical protein
MARKPEILHAIERLLVVYSKPRHVSNLGDLATEWERVLWPVTTDALEFAVGAYLESNAEYFPKPGQIAALCRTMPRRGQGPGATESAYRTWELDWGAGETTDERGTAHPTFTACPVCNVAPAYHPRFAVRHLAAMHRQAGVSIVGYSDEVEEFYRAVPKQAPRPGNVAGPAESVLAGEQPKRRYLGDAA